MHRIADHFPADAQHTSDPDWIRFGVGRGWALLTQDQRIRYHEDELAAVAECGGVMFVLANGNLTIEQRIAWFCSNRSAVFAAAVQKGPALYKIYPDRIAKTWP